MVYTTQLGMVTYHLCMVKLGNVFWFYHHYNCIYQWIGLRETLQESPIIDH